MLQAEELPARIADLHAALAWTSGRIQLSGADTSTGCLHPAIACRGTSLRSARTHKVNRTSKTPSKATVNRTQERAWKDHFLKDPKKKLNSFRTRRSAYLQAHAHASRMEEGSQLGWLFESSSSKPSSWTRRAWPMWMQIASRMASKFLESVRSHFVMQWPQAQILEEPVAADMKRELAESLPHLQRPRRSMLKAALLKELRT